MIKKRKPANGKKKYPHEVNQYNNQQKIPQNVLPRQEHTGVAFIKEIEHLTVEYFKFIIIVVVFLTL